MISLRVHIDYNKVGCLEEFAQGNTELYSGQIKKGFTKENCNECIGDFYLGKV